MKTRVAILDDFQGVARAFGDWDRLNERADVTVFSDHLSDDDALVERLQPFAALALMRERTRFPRAVIERLPNLQLITTSGMWNAAIDLAACEERGIVVSGTQSGGGGTAQLTVALVLALAQQITVVDRDMREGRWQTVVGEELAGKTIGLVGLGRVGSRVARLAQAFDMRTIAWSANLTDERAAAVGVERVERDDLFRDADVVSVHLVLGERTRGLIGRPQLELMKSSAYLVNTSRGPIVDEAALIELLRARRIAGAGIDVYAVEPLPPDHPFRSLPNTVLTPHIGYVSRESYALYYTQMREDVQAWLDGAPVRRIQSGAVPDKLAAAPKR